MKKMKSITILVVLFALTSYSFGAKEENFKFGKVSMEELNANICPSDSNAHAYYIFDKGEAFYNYINGFQVKYKRHFRIKIIDKSGFENATFAIPYYDSPSIKEKIYSLKAFTYNVENGKIVKVELDKKNIFDEETTKNWKQKKFALPNVKEGSVIEVSYDITSDRYWSLNSIQFQYEIPVMVSDYSVEIPQYFTFNQAHRGSVMAKTTSKSGNQSLRTAEGQSLQFSTTVYNYHIENVPAFPIGEELTTIDNYITKAEFELASVQIPGAVYKDYTTTWADVNKTFLDDEDFGNRLKMTSFLKETANTIKQNLPTEQEQMKAALNFIQKKMKWNETNSCWCFTPLKKAFDSGEKLSQMRKILAKVFEKKIVEELKQLDLDKAEFKINFEDLEASPDILFENGIDRIDFEISLNEGEPVKSLSKVASGGEKSRFMLALKTIHSLNEGLSILVLDEIDTGVSGKTAAKVAQKMKELSKDMQVIVITHLPQVAAKADYQYAIYKVFENNRMVTKIDLLTEEARIKQIGMMLSDDSLSSFALEQAKMLLSNK